MPNVTNFSASTPNANVRGTLTDERIAEPAVPSPGLVTMGPRVTFNFVTDPWSKDNSYTYYDVVNISGASYIARQNVPAGIEITNEDYWIRWNDANAQFAELENVVNSFDERITANTNAITENTNEINELTKTPDMIVIGDSFSTDSPDASQAPLWHTIVGQRLGYNVHNFAVGGAGYLVSNNKFSNQVDAAVSSISDKQNVKLAYVYGGWNDVYNQTGVGNVYDECRNIINQIQSNFPNARIIIMGCNTFLYNPNVVSGDTARGLSYALNSAANYMGVEYVDTHTLGLGNTTFFMQGANEHPNAYGERMIAATAIQLNSNNYISPQIVSNDITGGTGYLSAEILGSTVNLYLDFTATDISASVDIPYHMIPTIPTMLLYGSDGSIHNVDRGIINQAMRFTVSGLTSGTRYTGYLVSSI